MFKCRFWPKKSKRSLRFCISHQDLPTLPTCISKTAVLVNHDVSTRHLGSAARLCLFLKMRKLKLSVTKSLAKVKGQADKR